MIASELGVAIVNVPPKGVFLAFSSAAASPASASNDEPRGPDLKLKGRNFYTSTVCELLYPMAQSDFANIISISIFRQNKDLAFTLYFESEEGRRRMGS